MRQADRILKSIYRESFIRITDNHFEKNSLFDLSNESFRAKCKTNYLKLYPYNYSGDELDAILNSQCTKLKSMFNETDAIYMFPYYSKKLFKIKNKQIIVSYEHLLEWDGFQNKVDANAFIGSYSANGYNEELIKNTNIVISHDNERIYNILSSGVCEGHMHLKGSGLTTELSWIAFLKSSFVNTLKVDSFIDNDNNFREFKSYGYTVNEISLSLQKVRLARIILDQYEELKTNKKVLNDLKKLLYINDLDNFKSEALLQESALDKLMFNLIQKLNQREKFSVLSERQFYEKIFRELIDKSLNTFQINLFNYYIWGASIFKFELNQDNVGMGFQKFKHYENVKDELIDNNTQIYRSVFEKYYEEGVIKKIEFRIAPKNIHEINELSRELDKINHEVYSLYLGKKSNNLAKLSLIKYGFIIHYIKRDDLAQDPDFDQLGRFKKYLSLIETDAQIVENALTWEANKSLEPILVSEFKKKIVAIDAANTEIGCPPEIFGKFFRRHRYISDPIGGINFTFHVGEEFKTLESGIRNIDETIDYFEYRRGDRLGHALALGIQVDSYYKKKRYKIVTSLQDHIDNLAWLYGLYSNSKYLDEKNLTLLNAMYERCKHELFMDFLDFPFTISDYIQSMKLRSDDSNFYTDRSMVLSTSIMLQEKRLCEDEKAYQFNNNNPDHKIAFLNTKARLLHYHYAYDEGLICNGRNTIEYTVDEDWITLVSKAQIIVKEKLIDRGIVVEANPSSNRKISSVQLFSELPFLKMNSFRLEDSNKGHIPITINTDDSAIFQTNLSNEYSLVARSLELEGYDSEKIYSYLEYLRESSCTHNFVH